MKKSHPVRRAPARFFLTLCTLALCIPMLRAQTTAFTYQGELTDTGSAATGNYDLRFTIYDASTNGDVIGSSLTNSATSVSNGLFSVTLDFGNVFSGSALWLEIDARTNGSAGGFTALYPRQEFTSAPYAIQALNASNATVAASASSVSATNVSGTLGLSQLPSSVLTNSETSITLNGSFSGNGNGLTNLNAAQLNGSATLTNLTVSGSVTLATPTVTVSSGTTPIMHFDSSHNTFLGGLSGNSGNATGAQNTTVGYGTLSANLSGASNTALGYEALAENTNGGNNTAVGEGALLNTTGGSGNTGVGVDSLFTSRTGTNNTGVGVASLESLTNSSYNIALGYGAGAFIIGGSSNIMIGNFGSATDTNLIRIGTLQTAAYIAGTIYGNGGGLTNIYANGLMIPNTTTTEVVVNGSGQVGIGTNSPTSALQVVGQVQASSFVGGSGQMMTVSDGFIGGGFENTNSSSSGVIAGGAHNNAYNGSGTVIGGGTENFATNKYATIGGGQQNVAGGQWSTIPGGNLNTASGDYSFAAGRGATASGLGSFVWADASGTGMSSTSSNQFLILAGGGVGIGTSSPGAQLEVNGTFMADAEAIINSSLLVDGGTLTVNSSNNFVGMGITTPAVPLEVSNANNMILQLDSSSTVGTWFNLRNTSSGGDTWRFISTGSGNGEGTGKLLIQSANSGTRIQIDTAGDVGIGYSGATSFTNKLAVNGTVLCTTLYQTSDRTLKKDIAPLGETLDKIMALKPATYRFKDESDSEPMHTGLIAQDVREIFPDAVEQAGDHLALDYNDLNVASIKALQELKQEKDSEIASLRTENAQLGARLEKLEQLVAKQSAGGQ